MGSSITAGAQILAFFGIFGGYVDLRFFDSTPRPSIMPKLQHSYVATHSNNHLGSWDRLILKVGSWFQ